MCSECVMLTSLFQNHDRSLWLVYDYNFSGEDRGGDTFKTSSPYEKLLPLPTPFQDVVQKTGTILNRICVNTVNYFVPKIRPV